jgi:hypothetical protein
LIFSVSCARTSYRLFGASRMPTGYRNRGDLRVADLRLDLAAASGESLTVGRVGS